MTKTSSGADIRVRANGKSMTLADAAKIAASITHLSIASTGVVAFELPDELPAATDVCVDNCPGLTALPELPAATVVRVYNCPGLTPPRRAPTNERHRLHHLDQWRLESAAHPRQRGAARH